jgi:hypothetical protein
VPDPRALRVTYAGAVTEPDMTSDQRLLQLVFDKFQADGVWPLIDDLQLDFDHSSVELDVVAVGRALNPSLLRIDHSYQGHVWLTLPGISACHGGQAQLEDLLYVVQEGVRGYLTVGLNAPVSSDDLRASLGWDDVRLARVHLLVQSLPGFGGGQSSATSWARFVSRDVPYSKG